MDFTYKVYDHLLDCILQAGYQVVTVRDYLKGTESQLTLILRHDVEWNPYRALALAKIEEAYGCRSTFYFRVDTKAFHLSIMRQLQEKGFEIGYHFNTLDRCRGNFQKAIALFERELEQLRKVGIDVKTVCSHGDPRAPKRGYKVNNEIFLRDPDLRFRNGLLGEAYLDVDFSRLQYISDAGARWNRISSTKELMLRISQKEWPLIYILVHPDYWSRSPFRAAALQVAAWGVRSFKINRAIIVGKQVLASLKRFIGKGYE